MVLYGLKPSKPAQIQEEGKKISSLILCGHVLKLLQLDHVQRACFCVMLNLVVYMCLVYLFPHIFKYIF